LNSEPQHDPEERARRAEEALAEALAERNRLWEQLQEKQATEADLEYWRGRAADIERSRWWRAGLPLRVLKRVADDPAGMLEGAGSAIRRRRRGA
jgi:hypothetical protein